MPPDCGERQRHHLSGVRSVLHRVEARLSVGPAGANELCHRFFGRQRHLRVDSKVGRRPKAFGRRTVKNGPQWWTVTSARSAQSQLSICIRSGDKVKSETSWMPTLRRWEGRKIEQSWISTEKKQKELVRLALELKMDLSKQPLIRRKEPSDIFKKSDPKFYLIQGAKLETKVPLKT